MSNCTRARVLFMQSQAFFGADSTIHAQLMRHFDREQVDVHVACTTDGSVHSSVSAAQRLRAIPNLHFRPSHFGPTLNNQSRWMRLRQAPSALALPFHLLGLAAYIRRHGIQIIHGTEKPRDSFYGVLLGKLTGARSVVHMHVNYGDWQSATVKWALRHADAIVGVSQFTADSIVAAGLPRERVFVVHNSLDVSGWSPTLDGHATRRALGIAETAPVVGIVARLFHWKGHSDLIDALAIVAREFPDVKLVVVGDDDPRAHPGGGSYRAELEAQARRLGLAQNVIFTAFRLDIPQLMAAFDVFALPSWEEPFGMVFLEAMAMERPVVAYTSGGAAEVVVPEQTGLLAEPKSIEGLAAAIVRLLRDPALRRRIGEAGRRRVEQVFSPAQMCAAMLEVYQRTLQPSTPAVQRRVCASRD